MHWGPTTIEEGEKNCDALLWMGFTCQHANINEHVNAKMPTVILGAFYGKLKNDRKAGRTPLQHCNK